MKLITSALLSTLFLVSLPSIAATGLVTKSVTPPRVTVTQGGGDALSQFSLVSTDFASGTLSARKTLLGIDWKTTYYPNNTETVKLCYYLPYQSGEVGCIVISPNSSGTTTAFNNQQFGNGSRVIITHKVYGAAPAMPLTGGKDSVTFKYSY